MGQQNQNIAVKIPLYISMLVVSLALFSCGQSIEVGERHENPIRAEIDEIAVEPTAFMDELVRVKGWLVISDEVYFLQSSEGSEIVAFPVGIEFSDSLLSTKITVEGTAFFHEELEKPAVAVDYLKGRFPRKIPEDR